MEIAIMIEGQNGLNWPRWQRIAIAVEELGFAGLYRSDHYTNMNAPDKDSLELWISLAWLASHTKRIEFAPLVSPVSFRQPTMTARMATAVDDLSNGRLTLGLGAGWQEREHANYGWNLLSVAERFDRFDEGLEVLTRLLNSNEPVDFDGRYYHLNEAVLLPRPSREGGPPILVGGNGPKRTLQLAARYAEEWNGVYLRPVTFADLNSRLDEFLVVNGRRPEDVRRSLMTGIVFASDSAGLKKKLSDKSSWWSGREPADLQKSGVVTGVGDEILPQLQKFAEAGVQRIMLQWLELDDLDGLESLAQVVN